MEIVGRWRQAGEKEVSDSARAFAKDVGMRLLFLINWLYKQARWRFTKTHGNFPCEKSVKTRQVTRWRVEHRELGGGLSKTAQLRAGQVRAAIPLDLLSMRKLVYDGVRSRQRRC